MVKLITLYKKIKNSFIFNFKPQIKRSIFSQDAKLAFSQDGEDLVLVSLLEQNYQKKGFYLDVGAHDPFRFSNTAIFYKNGWRGINVEPNPDAKSTFDRERPEDINLSIAISSTSGTKKFYIYNEPALNGIDNDRREELKDTAYRLEKVTDIKTGTLENILVKFQERFAFPNFLSIDVEGHEMEVLVSNNWKLFPFEFILVEQRLEDLTLISQSEIYAFLSGLSYRPVACTGRTVIYKRSSQP
jgi:FkbM family methyltransferase